MQFQFTDMCCLTEVDDNGGWSIVKPALEGNRKGGIVMSPFHVYHDG